MIHWHVEKAVGSLRDCSNLRVEKCMRSISMRYIKDAKVQGVHWHDQNGVLKMQNIAVMAVMEKDYLYKQQS